ncbi:hypothetical protein FRC12_022138 [Ceratobasidium sp. 428]|nr:hypothetical protein FRC12_022138 [Ceratobasidium sp. 428]
MLEPREREISPARRIELSQTYGIPGWVRGAVDELGWRREPITPEEANMLGPDMSATVSRLRERTYNDARVDIHPFILYPVLLLCALPILSALLQGTVYTLVAAKDLLSYMIMKTWSRLPEIILFLNPPLILIALVRSNRGMDKPVDSNGVARTRPVLLDAVLLLCMLPGVKILVKVIMLANEYVGDMIAKTLWFLLRYVTPLLSREGVSEI